MQKDPVTIRRDSGGRRGKTVSLVEGLQMHPAGKEELLKALKKKLGTGGTLKGGVLELQGDQRPRLKSELEVLGFKVRVIA